MNIENAYSAIAQEILAFIGNRSWDKAQVVVGVYYKMIRQSWSVFYGQQVFTDTEDGDWFKPSDKISDSSSKAIYFLRDHLLKTTGERIWGLTFTLYPDGKFNVDYDYNKPADYDDSQEGEGSIFDAFEALNGGQPEIKLTGDFKTDTLAQAMAELQQQTRLCESEWGLGEEQNWQLDMNKGVLILSFDDERAWEAAVQVVGTYDTQQGSFMWGWDHPSVPEPLRQAAQAVYRFGEHHQIPEFTQKIVHCSEHDAWQFTAAARKLYEAAGAYRGDSNGTWVYMTFDTPELLA